MSPAERDLARVAEAMRQTLKRQPENTPEAVEEIRRRLTDQQRQRKP